MRLWRIIATATAVEVACGAAAVAILGLGGAWNGWLDVLNQFAPLWFALCILAAPVAALLIAPGRGRNAVTGAAVIGAVVSGWAVLPDLAAAIGPWGRAAASQRPLKIVTFNAWSENSDPDAVVKRIKAADPDAAALIEMSWPVEHVSLKALQDRYPYRTLPKRGCPGDMQLISKRPFAAYGCQVTDQPSRPGLTETIVWGRTTAPDGRPFTLATTHYAWPFPHSGQEMQRPILARFVRAHGDQDMILTGEFNLTPWSFALRRQDRDLRPLARRTHAIFTWPAMIARLDKPAPFAFLPIDHIYAGSAWRTRSVRRLARAGSDHYGIEAIFTRRP
jgi:endonuclease/exonuclease/phosphatase (EEP) superfamily protein YafD